MNDFEYKSILYCTVVYSLSMLSSMVYIFNTDSVIK
jgi:hypothetical protein